MQAGYKRKRALTLIVILRDEGSSSPCIAALYIEEDSSLSLRMTSVF